MDKQFDDFMEQAFGKKIPIRLKRPVEADILAGIALANELMDYLCKMGFRQNEIHDLSLNLFTLKEEMPEGLE